MAAKGSKPWDKVAPYRVESLALPAICPGGCVLAAGLLPLAPQPQSLVAVWLLQPQFLSHCWLSASTQVSLRLGGHQDPQELELTLIPFR